MGQPGMMYYHRVFSIHFYRIPVIYLPLILGITYLAIPKSAINLSPGTERSICANFLTTSMYYKRIYRLASADSGSCTSDSTFHNLGKL
jgi:hypothetical protein